MPCSISATPTEFPCGADGEGRGRSNGNSNWGRMSFLMLSSAGPDYFPFAFLSRKLSRQRSSNSGTVELRIIAVVVLPINSWRIREWP